MVLLLAHHFHHPLFLRLVCPDLLPRHKVLFVQEHHVSKRQLRDRLIEGFCLGPVATPPAHVDVLVGKVGGG